MPGPISLRAVKRKHNRFQNFLRKELTEAMTDVGERFVDHVRTKSRFNRRTPGGASQKEATHWRLIRSRKGRLLRVKHPKRATAKRVLVANVLEHGSKRHPIPLIPGRKMLRFRGRTGEWVFRRQVMHPGTKPYRFFHNAGVSARRFSSRRIESVLKSSARRF